MDRNSSGSHFLDLFIEQRFIDVDGTVSCDQLTLISLAIVHDQLDSEELTASSASVFSDGSMLCCNLVATVGLLTQGVLP